MKNDKRLILRLPAELLSALKGIENRSEFIRQAVLEKLMKIRKIDRMKYENKKVQRSD